MIASVVFGAVLVIAGVAGMLVERRSARNARRPLHVVPLTAAVFAVLLGVCTVVFSLQNLLMGGSA